MLGTRQTSSYSGDEVTAVETIVAGRKSSTSRLRSATKSQRSGASARPVRASRRIGSESSKTRADLLDAAEELMRKEGYAAVTSRKVANQAKLTPQLVHYYFRTMDDLFLALWRRFVSNNVERQAQALASPEPLRALWEFSRKSADTVLETEFLSLAHHRKTIRNELARDGDNFRSMQFEGLSRALGNYQLDDDGCSAEIVAVLLTSISRNLVMEKDLGMSAGHRKTFEYVERWLDRLERRKARSRRAKGSGQHSGEHSYL